MITSKLGSAVEYATEVHGAQVRKGTTIPYVSHLLQVAGLVLEFGGNEDEAIAGLLHDAAEDAGGEPTLEEIRARFGSAVEGWVRENSDSVTEAKAEKAPWRVRKQAYVGAIAHKSEGGLLVSVCDKIHNARSLVTDTRNVGEEHWKRFNASREDIHWYYGALATAFRARVGEFPRIGNGVQVFESVVSEMVTGS